MSSQNIPFNLVAGTIKAVGLGADKAGGLGD